jgi:hypothetical protein
MTTKKAVKAKNVSTIKIDGKNAPLIKKAIPLSVEIKPGSAPGAIAGSLYVTLSVNPIDGEFDMIAYKSKSNDVNVSAYRYGKDGCINFDNYALFKKVNDFFAGEKAYRTWTTASGRHMAEYLVSDFKAVFDINDMWDKKFKSEKQGKELFRREGRLIDFSAGE